MKKTLRLTIAVAPGTNVHAEGERQAAVLFNRCRGDVAEAMVLAFLRLTKAEGAANPGTGAAHFSRPIAALLAALEP